MEWNRTARDGYGMGHGLDEMSEDENILGFWDFLIYRLFLARKVNVSISISQHLDLASCISPKSI